MGAKLWEVMDEFWRRVGPLIPERRERDPEKSFIRKLDGGRKPKPARVVFEAIVFVLRTGCQWKAMPAVHKRFLEWEKAGFFEALWRSGLTEYDEMEGIAWRWQSIDGAMMKAPLAQEQVGPNPTDRRKKREQAPPTCGRAWRSVTARLIGANRHNVTQLETVLEAIQVKRPTPPMRRSKHLCTDAGYRGAPAMKAILAHGYIPHVKGRRQEAKELKRHPGKLARR